MYVLIYREAAEGEGQNWEVQWCRDAVIQRWGRGGAPLPIFSSHLFFPSSLLIFLMLRGYSALLYGLFRELLQVFRGLLKVFKLFSKNF